MRTAAEIKKEYDRWLDRTTAKAESNTEDLRAELAAMDETEIEDAFYRDLAFGTGGLRGVIGAGTNRINIFTVAKATQGLANYVNENFPENLSVAIAYDSRIKSDLFSKTAASVLAANGIKAHIYPQGKRFSKSIRLYPKEPLRQWFAQPRRFYHLF